MLLKNYDCYTAEDFEGDAIWFDLSSSLRCLEIALHINCENAGYVFHLMYLHMMIPNIAIHFLRTQDQSHSQTHFVTRNRIIATSIVF